MTDSSAYSSLFALVDSHLSKISLQENGENNDNNSIKLPPFSLVVPNGSVSESSLSLSRKLPASPFNISENSINTVLASQLSNMFKAKELKKEAEEKERLAEETRRLKKEEEKNSIIDLMQAIQTPSTSLPLKHVKEEVPSMSNSCESLFNANFNEWNDETEKVKTLEPLLPCVTDMSYILNEKTNMSKGSSFGKVLSSRLRPVAAPYLRTEIASNINRFLFNTPSPCDILKEKLRKPTMSCNYTFNIHDFI